MLGAIRRHSAAIAAEFDRLMAFVRGWELAAGYGTLQSFSDPTLPRVMGINVPYGLDDGTGGRPFCFMWFGHELGHTKSYLIETILHLRGHSLTSNPERRTEVLPRVWTATGTADVVADSLYASLRVDTAPRRSKQTSPRSPGPFPRTRWRWGTIFEHEIEEAFDFLSQDSQITPCGHAVLARLWGLSKEVLVRWRASSANGCSPELNLALRAAAIETTFIASVYPRPDYASPLRRKPGSTLCRYA